MAADAQLSALVAHVPILPALGAMTVKPKACVTIGQPCAHLCRNSGTWGREHQHELVSCAENTYNYYHYQKTHHSPRMEDTSAWGRPVPVVGGKTATAAAGAAADAVVHQTLQVTTAPTLEGTAYHPRRRLSLPETSDAAAAAAECTYYRSRSRNSFSAITAVAAAMAASTVCLRPRRNDHSNRAELTTPPPPPGVLTEATDSNRAGVPR